MTKSKNRLFAELVSDDGSGSTQLAKVNAAFAPSATPEVTIVNSTHEDTDGGREGKLKFQGEQSGGELSTLAEIQGSHDGTADDQKGDLIFKTNDGSDGASPTERLRIDSVGAMTVTATDQSVATFAHSSSSTAALNGGAQINIKNTDNTNGNQTSIAFRDSAGNASSAIFGFNTDHSDGEGFMKFGCRDDSGTFAERIRVDHHGLKFNGDTAAANALDDYEEGTFNFEMVGYHGSPSPKIQVPAQYTKIGNTIHFWAIKTGMNTTSYASNMWFSGLPFNSPSPYAVGNMYGSYIGTYTGYGPFTFISGTIVYALLHQSNASSWSAVMHNVVTSGGEIYLYGTYKV